MSPLKRMMRKVQDFQEARFARKRRLIPCGDSGLIRLEPSVYDGPRVTLRTGRSIEPGMRVADIHLDSRKIAEFHESMPPMKARIAAVRGTEAAFVWIAGWLALDSQGHETLALRSTTLLDLELRRFGFEILPLPVWPWIFIGVYMKWLSYVYRAEKAGVREKGAAPFVNRIMPRQAWMTREDFLERYSEDRTP
jgi:hypothetical protein